MITNRTSRLKSAATCLVLILIVLLTGCTALNSTTAPLDYRLEFDSDSIRKHSRHGGILRVERPQADAGVNTRNIAYRLAPYQLQYYTKSRWADVPTRMLRTVLTSAFDQSGLFDATIDSNQLPADYMLSTQLLRLEQQLPAEGQPTVQLQLRYQLISLPARQLLDSGLISVNTPASARDAEAAVTAANVALSDLISKLVDSVAAALSDQQAK